MCKEHTRTVPLCRKYKHVSKSSSILSYSLVKQKVVSKVPMHCSLCRKSSKPLDVVAIDHFPSLLPRESSTRFANDSTPHLLKLDQVCTSEPLWWVTWVAGAEGRGEGRFKRKSSIEFSSFYPILNPLVPLIHPRTLSPFGTSHTGSLVGTKHR